MNGDLEAHENVKGTEKNSTGLQKSLRNATQPELLKENPIDPRKELVVNQMKRYSEI